LIAGTANWTTDMVGTTPGWLEARARTIADGRVLTAADEKGVAAVSVLTSTGSSSSASDEDDQALVPLSTMEQEIGGNSRTSVDTIYVQATSQATLSAAYQEANTLLLNLHGVSAANPDFTINSQQSLLSTATSVNKTLTVLLAGIA